MKCVVIGGGIIGLSSAYYLRKSGHEVTVIDQSDMSNGCSYGNAGYVCPSHFIPMPTPGIISQGFKWMLNSRSPFYVQPRLSLSLIDWGLKFMKSATSEKVEKAAVPLRDIAVFSQQLYEQEFCKDERLSFSYAHKGLLDIFQTEKNAEHAIHTVAKSKELGLDVDLLSYAEMQALEPGTKINALGAIFFKCDGHLSPPQLMKSLKACLKADGVEFITGARVDRFEISGGMISGLFAGEKKYTADQVILAAGSWSRELASKLDLKIPMVAGRGYSVTYEDSPFQLNYPAILVEGRTAITPLENGRMRFGGTMEITSTDEPVKIKRVEGILAAVKSFYPSFNLPMPEKEKIWSGFRPCSADGLPYIGKLKSIKNCVIATGHSMLGLSLGAGTGKLVSELVNDQPSSISLNAFSPERFN
ncbi:MAG: FAD-dependent oxidoreductase [Chitinophagaceae bacterium]